MYNVNYSVEGKPSSIQREDGASIPFEPLNKDFRKFLEWNKAQKAPLNYEKSIAVEPPKPTETLEEKIGRIVDVKLAATVTK